MSFPQNIVTFNDTIAAQADETKTYVLNPLKPTNILVKKNGGTGVQIRVTNSVRQTDGSKINNTSAALASQALWFEVSDVATTDDYNTEGTLLLTGAQVITLSSSSATDISLTQGGKR